MMNDGVAPKHSKLSFKGKATNVLTNAIPNTPTVQMIVFAQIQEQKIKQYKGKML